MLCMWWTCTAVGLDNYPGMHRPCVRPAGVRLNPSLQIRARVRSLSCPWFSQNAGGAREEGPYFTRQPLLVDMPGVLACRVRLRRPKHPPGLSRPEGRFVIPTVNLIVILLASFQGGTRRIHKEEKHPPAAAALFTNGEL